MNCTIESLKHTLEEILESGISPDTEVRFLAQPSWPFEYAVAGYVLRSDIDEIGEDDSFQSGGGKPECLLLVEGYQQCYGSRDYFDGYSRFY